MSGTTNPKVFISYSWSSSEKVLELAERLLANGVDVILDKWDLKEGHDKYAFMEQSVNNPEVIKVLIICDKVYTEKANSRAGGVGDETVIISPEIYGNIEQEKFIPVIFETDENLKPYCPAYIKSRIYIDLSIENEGYEANYEKLLRTIHNKPLYRKPAIGAVPEWLEDEAIDLSAIRDVIKQIRGNKSDSQTKIDFLIRKAKDEFCSALLAIPKNDKVSYDEALLIQIDEEKIVRDLYIEFLEALIYNDFSVEDIVPLLFEQLYNETHNTVGRSSHSNAEFEMYEFAIWELFICTTAVCLHYEKYETLYEILTHSYFLREYFHDKQLKNHTFVKFQSYLRTIEEVCKPKCENPKFYSLTSEILVKREKKPIITKETLSNADVVLYQMSIILGLDGNYYGWFPQTYYYCLHNQPMWQKLKSKKYCEKFMPLFGVNTIDELKDKISSCKINQELRYKYAFDVAPVILSSISEEEIGSIN